MIYLVVIFLFLKFSGFSLYSNYINYYNHCTLRDPEMWLKILLLHTMKDRNINLLGLERTESGNSTVPLAKIFRSL